MAWFKTWFNTPYYHLLYQNRDYAEAENFISNLVSTLEIPKNSEIIDLACGKGRHSVFLNKLGYSVLGLDLSEESIAHNQEFEKDGIPYLKFEVHDMREPIDSKPVEVVVNLFTSFGYFESHEEDDAVFKSVYNVLKPGGIFVLDFLNEQYVKNTLVPQQDIIRGEIKFDIRKRIENHHVIKDIIFADDGEEYHFYEQVKLHSHEEIEEFARTNQFSVKRIFGDYHLHEFDPETSPRCIMVLVKESQI